VARSINDRHPGCITHTAAAREVGVGSGLSVRDDRPYTIDRYAQLLRHHEGLCHTRATDIRIAGDDAHAAVAVQHDGGARVQSGSEPEAAGPPAARSLARRRRPWRVGASRFEALFQADLIVCGTVGRAVAFSNGVLQTELDRIDCEDSGDLVHQGFGREGCHRRAWSAIRRNLWLVDDHIVGFYAEIRDL